MLLLGLVVLTALAVAGARAGAARAANPATPVSLSPSAVANALFVAGDVGRLSQIPSGTESVVLEKVLQQLYLENAALPAAQAVSDIQGLESSLGSGPHALSTASLTVMAGNQRILAILRALTDANPPAEVLHALAQVTDRALIDGSQSTAMFGQAFDAAADSLSTITYTSFAPARVLAATASLAATNHTFGVARDALWKGVSNESVFDSSKTLLAENPALQSAAVQAFVSKLAADGSLSTTIGALEAIVDGGVKQIGNQNCALAPGTTGSTPSDCASGALHDAQLVASACPNGISSTAPACTSARGQAQADQANEIKVIAAEQAASIAAADALSSADSALARAQIAEAQAAAEIADEENQYLAYQNNQSYEKAGFDVATLAVSLAVSEIDPFNAFTSLFNVVGDAVGFGFSGPDPNTIILQGIQAVSQQISDFEQYTQSAFHALDTQLAGLANQVAQESFQLSSQLTQAQGQITQLASKLTTLQGSVDHLQSEVQSLFAQGARNDLGTLINQYIGYQQANGVPLPQTQFAQAAGALYQDATSTALTQTVLTIPSSFDALSASGLDTANDPLTLDSNINLFNVFGSAVTDSPFGWPGALASSCAPGADLGHNLCLPDPDFWATSARAFAQLLTENPQYVTPTRLAQLDAIVQEGNTIQAALRKLTVNDVPNDTTGTGNSTLDAAINYYKYWGEPNHPGGTPPSLTQALKNEEQHYLDVTPTPVGASSTLTYSTIQPWGHNDQTPDDAGLVTTNQLHNLPLCASEVNPGTTGNINPNDYIYPATLATSDISFLPAPVRNAARLGSGQLSACWEANFTGPRDSNGGPLTITMHYFFSGTASDGSAVSGEIGNVTATINTASYCPPNGYIGNSYIEAINAVKAGCNNTNAALAGGTQTTIPDVALTGAAMHDADVALSNLQAGIYNDILSSGQTLTSGTSQATDVESAALRLAGANAIIDGYISLGLPQALASDDTLHGFVSGQNEDAFAPTDPAENIWNVPYAASVPAQLVNFYKAALAVRPGFDPADFVADLVDIRATALANALRPHIVPGLSAQSARVGARSRLASRTTPTPASGVLAESNPVIGPTLDRLAETRLGLGDVLSNGTKVLVHLVGTGAGTVTGGGLNCPSACTGSPTPGTTVTLTATPKAGSTFAGWSGACEGLGTCTLLMSYDQSVTATFIGKPVPPPSGGTTARCTLKAASRSVVLAVPKGKRKRKTHTPKPGTLALTARCDHAATLTLTGVLTRAIGPKPKHGKQRVRREKLGPVRSNAVASRTVTLIVKLPADAVGALKKKARETVVFTLAAAAGGRSTRVTTKSLTLHGR